MGADSQISVEKKLLAAVVNKNYDYVHLISSSDIPLMTVEYFKLFFTNEVYIGFFNGNRNFENRIKYYYPDRYINLRKDPLKVKRIFVSSLIAIQKIIGINRIKRNRLLIKKGSNWFSIKGKYIANILNFDDSIFKHSFLGDELYIQTILGNFEKITSNEHSNCRYIDWNRGNPYTFTMENIPELSKK